MLRASITARTKYVVGACESSTRHAPRAHERLARILDFGTFCQAGNMIKLALAAVLLASGVAAAEPSAPGEPVNPNTAFALSGIGTAAAWGLAAAGGLAHNDTIAVAGA